MKKSKNIMKLGIVGHGFVGKATDWAFEGIEKFIVDPLYKTSIDDLKKFDPDIIFVCVPTPMAEDGSQDNLTLFSVVKELSKKCLDSTIVIKSTVIPGMLEDLKILNKKIIYNPEFLREKHANEDFMNSKMIILGGDRGEASKVSKFYLDYSKCITKQHVFMDLISASFVKYAINTFLATKVLFFNELNDLYSKSSASDDWKSIIEIISLDGRIGSSHMNVPGHDGRRGFGGACFPKDTQALLKYAASIGVNLSALETVINKNNLIRSSYSDLDKREKEQNINYKSTKDV